MIKTLPKAKLSSNQLHTAQDGEQETRAVEVFCRSGEEERHRPICPAVPQPSSSLIGSTYRLSSLGSGIYSRSSPSSASSPLHGSTLCPTPQSAQLLCDTAEPTEKYCKDLDSPSSFQKKFDPILFTVEELSRIDDIGRIPVWKKLLYRLSPLTTIMSMVAYFMYYAYRIHCTLDAQRVYNQIYIMAWIFVSAEGCVACGYSSTSVLAASD